MTVVPLVVGMVVFAYVQVAKPQAPPKTPAKRAATKSASPARPRISDALVAAIIEESSKRSLSPGLQDYANGSQKLFVTSERAMIAWRTSRAAETGGRYTPSASDRIDTVSINCGDNDIGDVFNCVSVRVQTPEGRVIKALSYSAGENGYTNALGAKWHVYEVYAEYPIAELTKGFSVDYAAPDGTEWTFQVSESDAAESLLLTLEPKK